MSNTYEQRCHDDGQLDIAAEIAAGVACPECGHELDGETCTNQACKLNVELSQEFLKTLEIKVDFIGRVSDPYNGYDAYYLVYSNVDDLSPEQAKEWVLPTFFVECHRPGGYFCTTVTAVAAANSTSRVICTVQHRYDI